MQEDGYYFGDIEVKPNGNGYLRVFFDIPQYYEKYIGMKEGQQKKEYYDDEEDKYLEQQDTIQAQQELEDHEGLSVYDEIGAEY